MFWSMVPGRGHAVDVLVRSDNPRRRRGAARGRGRLLAPRCRAGVLGACGPGGGPASAASRWGDGPPASDERGCPAAAGGMTSTPHCGRCKAPLPWVADADDASFPEVAERAPAGRGGPVGAVVRAVPHRQPHPRAARRRVRRWRKGGEGERRRRAGPQRRFGVQGIPTLVLLRGGQEVSRQVGAAPAGRVRGWIAGAVRDAA